MGLIDSHAHLTFPELSGVLSDVLVRCVAAGVDRVITVGTHAADARAAVELARQHEGTVFAAAGFHPHEAAKVTSDEFAAMEDLWRDPQVVALGEMGLDYHYDFAPRNVQQEVFGVQLEMASAFDKPIVIHSREAFDDTISILSERGFVGRRVVFHCFTGTPDEAARIAAHGWRISFTGVVTFKRSQELQAVARAYPADQLMIETDAPYLSPEPVRHKRPNEPSYVAHTARFLADLRGETFEELAASTAENTAAFFGLPASRDRVGPYPGEGGHTPP